MKNRLVLHPFLFALFPVLFQFAKNIDDLQIKALLLPSLVVLGAAGVLAITLRLLTGNILKAGIIGSAIVVSFFLYGHILYIIRVSGLQFDQYDLLPNGALLGVILVGIVWLARLLIRTSSDLRLITRNLNLLGGLLVLFQVGAGAMSWGGSDLPARDEVVTELAGELPEKRPDIYYIIVDGYARHDILKEVFDFDNSAFLDHLRTTGFYVADSSHSNYPRTLQSLASSLNGDLLVNLREPALQRGELLTLTDLIQSSWVLKTLRSFGYKVVSFASGYDLTDLEIADIRLSPSYDLSEFEGLIVSTTPLPFIFSAIADPHQAHRRRVLYAFEKLPEISEVDHPFIVFAHIISPHPPFLFDEDGEDYSDPLPFSYSDGSHYFEKGGTAEEYITGYRHQVTYVTALLRECVDNILARHGDDPPIIIIQGDHGSGRYLNWESALSTWYQERFSILNAYYFPGVDSLPFYPQITPVNSFRTIFRTYFGLDLEPIPDRSFFSIWRLPYAYNDVTERLNDDCPPAATDMGDGDQ